ncbi:hypothetical protein ACQ5SK_26970 [Bradyrhizobium japonicum]
MRSISIRLAISLIGSCFAAASASGAPFPISGPGDPAEANLLPLLVDVSNPVQSGRGVVVGRIAGKLILATAGHVVAGGSQVSIKLYRKATVVPGAVVHATDPNEDDLALIEIPDNPQLRFDSICAAPEGSNQDRMKVWYYGQNWSTGSAGAFVKVAQAALLLEANGLDGVSEGDSGGAVLGQLGLIGILSNYIPALDIAQKQRISFTSIDRVKAAVKNKFGEAAWQIPVCASRPIFRIKPSTCERPGASGCWVGAALDAFRSAPMDFGVRNQLARGIGQFLGEAELNELLATASPAQRLDILLNAALVSSSDSARRWLDSALNGIDQEHDRGSRLRHNAQAIGVLLRRGDRNRASSLARRMVDFSKDWPFEQRAGALVQLAYYSTDLQDPTLREELASKLGELVATVPPESCSTPKTELHNGSKPQPPPKRPSLRPR